MIGAWGAVNPAAVTGLLDAVTTGIEVGGAVSMARQQRLAQQAALESQERIQAANAYALQAAAAQRGPSWGLYALGAGFVVVVGVGLALAFRRRR